MDVEYDQKPYIHAYSCQSLKLCFKMLTLMKRNSMVRQELKRRRKRNWTEKGIRHTLTLVFGLSTFSVIIVLIDV